MSARRPIRELLRDVIDLITNDATILSPTRIMVECETFINTEPWLPMDSAPRDWRKPILVHFGDGKPPLAVYWFIGCWLPCRRQACMRKLPEPVAWMWCPKVPAAPWTPTERKTKKELAEEATAA